MNIFVWYSEQKPPRMKIENLFIQIWEFNQIRIHIRIIICDNAQTICIDPKFLIFTFEIDKLTLYEECAFAAINWLTLGALRSHVNSIVSSCRTCKCDSKDRKRKERWKKITFDNCGEIAAADNAQQSPMKMARH